MIQANVVTNVLATQLGPISEWLNDPSVTEIMINPGGNVYVEMAGVISHKGRLLDTPQIDRTIMAVAKLVGKSPRADSADAIVYAGIDDLRFSGALMPVCPDGSFISIRKHADKSQRPSLEKLVEQKMLSQDQADTIADLLVTQHRNMFIVGGTGSGKTTLLNALLAKVPSHERIITIEDSREIQINQHIALVSNPDKKITVRDLVKLALRTRPDRLVLGETRGDETYDLIRGFNSGHPGSVSTLHGDSAEQGLAALEMMFQMSLPDNASMSDTVMRQSIAAAVNVVVFVERRIEMRDGVANVIRRVKEICLIKGVVNGKYDLENVA